MIIKTQPGWNWYGADLAGQCPEPQVWHSPAERVSELLGPDGEPLKVPFERPRIGFDLRPRRPSVKDMLDQHAEALRRLADR